MKNVWLILWVVLLLIQLVTYWLGEIWTPGLATVDPGQIELARTTNKAWTGMLPALEDRPDMELRDRAFARESMFVELRRQENRLRSSLSEIRISEDLEKWFAARGNQVDDGDFIQYMKGLKAWLETISQKYGSTSLERVYLMPDSRSGFPAIVFEMTGSPGEMGLRLQRMNELTGGWPLVELDMSKSASGAGWWILGSCLFESRGTTRELR